MANVVLSGPEERCLLEPSSGHPTELIVVAAVLIWRQSATPRETINDFNKIPPKGAGRYDRN